MSLISWIKFDYNTVYDLMGRTSVITEGNPTYSVGKIDYASTVTNSNGYNFWPVLITPRSFSISFWCLFPLSNSPTDWNTLLRISGSGGHHVIVQKSTNLLGVYASAFRSSGINVTSITSGWHHVAVRINNTGTTTPDYTGTTEFFIDGVKTGNTVNYACYADTGIEGFLCYQGSSTPGSGTVTQAWGTVSDFKIWDHLLSNEEIYEESLGMVAYYPLDSSTLYEASGRGRNPVNVGNSYYEPNENTINNGAWYFDGNPTGSAGTADYLETEDIILFRKDFLNAEASVSLWVKFTGDQIVTTASSIALMGTSTIDSTQAFFRVYKIDANNTGFTGFYFLSGDFQSSNYSVTNNVWHHIVNTVKKTDIGSGNANYIFTTYIDGTYMGTNTASSKTHRSLSLKNIGGLWGVNTVLGYLSDIRMYTKVLTQTDVDYLYKRKASLNKNGDLRTKNINSSFSPTNISNCVIWLDSSKLKFNDELSDGNSLSVWKNLAKDDFHFYQNTAGRKPIFKENIDNGYGLFDAVQFSSASSQCMYNTGFDSYSGVTVFLVGKPTSATAGRVLSCTGQNWLMGWYTSYKDRMYNTSGWIYSSTTAHGSTCEIYCANISRGSYSKFYNKTTLLANNATYTSSVNYPFCLGAYNGSDSAGSEFANAYLFELLVYDRSLTDNEQSAVMKYLTNKYIDEVNVNIDYDNSVTCLDINEYGMSKTPLIFIPFNQSSNHSLNYFVNDNSYGIYFVGSGTFNPFIENYSGLAFNGSSNYIDCYLSKNINISTNNESTLSFWMYTTANPAEKKCLISLYNNRIQSWLNTNGTINYGAYTSTSNQEFTSSGTVTLSAVNHICIVNKGANYSKCYINGSLDSNNVLAGNLVDEYRISIARAPGAATNYFSGKISNIAIWNKILSDKDIMNLYHSFSNVDKTLMSISKSKELTIKGQIIER